MLFIYTNGKSLGGSPLDQTVAAGCRNIKLSGSNQVCPPAVSHSRGTDSTISRAGSAIKQSGSYAELFLLQGEFDQSSYPAPNVAVRFVAVLLCFSSTPASVLWVTHAWVNKNGWPLGGLDKEQHDTFVSIISFNWALCLFGRVYLVAVNDVTKSAPLPHPKSVTKLGSPPKCSIFVPTHISAAVKSVNPKL